MQRDVELEATIVAKYTVVSPVLDERARRLWAATESLAIGYGGDALVSAATGLARQTIRNLKLIYPDLRFRARKVSVQRT